LCNTKCNSVVDCAYPAGCTAEDRCVQPTPPATTAPSGCTCDAVGTRPSPWSAALATLGALGAAFARRARTVRERSRRGRSPRCASV
jgi:hypothetical protein